MSSNGHTGGEATGASRQMLIVAICAMGLFVAALAMPATAPSPSPPSFDGQQADCEILLSEQPVPGQALGVTIRYDGEPVDDRPVWFNDRSVGRTDGDGRVTGTVPYEKELQIRVELPGDSRCRAGVDTGGEVSVPDSIAQSGLTLGVADPNAARAQQTGHNSSGSYPVRGRIDIAVARQPSPGESTTIRATIQGNPVPDATISVEGREVGQTDEYGEATITVPEESDDRLRVRVERGEFASTRAIEVLALSAGLRSGTLLVWPGQESTVAATLGDEPAEGATVTVDGEPIGETSENGTLAIQLPANPATQFTVSTGDQTATAPVWPAYAGMILAVLIFVGITFGIPALGYVIDGVRGFAVGCILVLSLYLSGGLFVFLGPVTLPFLLIGMVSVVLLAAGYLVGGRRGLAISAILLGVGYSLVVAFFLFGPPGVLAALVIEIVLIAIGRFLTTDYSASEGVTATDRWLRVLSQRCVGFLLAVTDRIEMQLDRVQLRLRSLSIEGARVWLVSLPGRVLGLVLALPRLPGQLREWLRGDDEASAARSESADSVLEQLSRRARFRQTWRQFASQVVPSAWPNRTAGEISRRAVEQGMATDPVEELTETFRFVEYGDGRLTERQMDRAKRALETIVEDRDEEGSP